MTVYYKGNLFLRKNIVQQIRFSTGALDSHNNFDIISLPYQCYKQLEPSDERKLCQALFNDLRYVSAFNHVYEASLSDTTIDILYKMIQIKPIKLSMNNKEIIYELIVDKNGNKYAKEVNTGYLFPIFNRSDLICYWEYWKLEGWISHYFKGYFSYKFKERENFDLCDCYCIERGVANYIEIEKYEEYKNKSSFNKKLEKLFKMNVFDDSCIKENSQSTSPNSSESMLNLTTENNNIPATYSPYSSNESLKSLQELKKILDSLSDEDLALLRDITQNNLLDMNINEYIKMSKEEKLAILSSQSNLGSRPKVNLKKEPLENNQGRQIIKK